jgi:hypothetical protein
MTENLRIGMFIFDIFVLPFFSPHNVHLFYEVVLLLLSFFAIVSVNFSIYHRDYGEIVMDLMLAPANFKLFWLFDNGDFSRFFWIYEGFFFYRFSFNLKNF